MATSDQNLAQDLGSQDVIATGSLFQEKQQGSEEMMEDFDSDTNANQIL
jgi:hypothetical protein